MYNTFDMKEIGHIKSDFSEKFGIPRQSGLVNELKAQIVFEDEFNDINAFKGLEGFSHIWLIWKFSKSVKEKWSPQVRPPRLGGNKYMGVFATRSPFRPNPIGLSCVKLEGIEKTKEQGVILHIAGADLLDGTPIFDVKPYIPYADSYPYALGGFTDETPRKTLSVVYKENCDNVLNEEKRLALTGVLSQDPRPAYQNDPERIYIMDFAQFEVKFSVRDDILTVVSVTQKENGEK